MLSFMPMYLIHQLVKSPFRSESGDSSIGENDLGDRMRWEGSPVRVVSRCDRAANLLADSAALVRKSFIPHKTCNSPSAVFSAAFH